MLLLEPVYHDVGNCRLYCTDNERNDWCIINLGTSKNPLLIPHSTTNEGEPLEPILDSTNWQLVRGVAGTEFVTGLSNRHLG